MIYNARGQRISDTYPDGQYTRTLTYPRDIFGRRTEIFDQHPSIGFTGADAFLVRIAGMRLYLGGSSSYLTHADAVGTTTMVTDQTGAVNGDSTRYPWGQLFQYSGNFWTTFADLDFQINEPVLPSATRGYDAGLGRWLTPDPDNAGAVVTDPQSWNMYAYALDSPATNSDPGGLDCLYLSSSSSSSINVGVQSGACTGKGGIYVNGTVDVNSFTYTGSELGYNFSNGQAGGAGVIDLSGSGGSPDLGLAALSLSGQWASTGIRNAAINMAVNGALVGAGELIGLGAEALVVPEAGATIDEVVAKASSTVGSQSIRVGSEQEARQAADEFLGPGKVPITERSTGGFAGWKSADGTRVVLEPHVDAAGAHMNFLNKLTGSNLHVRW